MAENWGGKLVAFFIVFSLFWIIGGILFKNAMIGFWIGLLAAGIFVGVGSNIHPPRR